MKSGLLAACVLCVAAGPVRAEWGMHDVPEGGFRIGMPGTPKREGWGIDEVEGRGGNGSVIFSNGGFYMVSYAALASGAHPKADALAVSVITKVMDFLDTKLGGGWKQTGTVGSGGARGVELAAPAREPGRVARARLLGMPGRRYLLVGIGPEESVSRFMGSIAFGPVHPPKMPASKRLPPVAQWQRQMLDEAGCVADLPGPPNIKKTVRIKDAGTGGLLGAQGFRARGNGVFCVVLFARAQSTTASRTDLRRLVTTASEKAHNMLRREFLKAGDQKWSEETSVGGAPATDVSFFTQSPDLEVRLRKIILPDRAYFLIAGGSPSDIARFFDSFEPVAGAVGKSPR